MRLTTRNTRRPESDLGFDRLEEKRLLAADIQVVQHPSFEADSGPPRLADVFEASNPRELSENLTNPDGTNRNLPGAFVTYFAIPGAPNGVSKWYTLTDSTDLVDSNQNTIDAQQGLTFLDLAGTPGFAAVNQNLGTEAGRKYLVDFYVTSNQGNNVANGDDLAATADRRFHAFWGGTPFLINELAPVMNTYDRFTFIMEAASDVTQLGFGGAPSPNSFNPAGEAIFGAVLDNVTAVAIDAVNDFTTISENFGFSSFRRDLLFNDSGIDRIVSANVIGCTPNIPASQCGTVIQDGFPDGKVFWDAPGADPLMYDFLSEGEQARVTIRYRTETSRNEGRNGAGPEQTVDETALWRINIIGENDLPTAINFSGSLTVNENLQTGGSAVELATLSAVDVDVNDTHVFELAAGAGDADNQRFEIMGNQLRIKQGEVVDFEAQSAYNIRIKTTDNFGGSFSDRFVINVTDLLEVDSIILNNNQQQRSRFTQLDISFDNAVTASEGAFTIYQLNANGQRAGQAGISAQAITANSVLLTFKDSLTDFGSLMDGNYELVVDSAFLDSGSIGHDLDQNGLEDDGEFAFRDTAFYRLFGDMNGDHLVNNTDFAVFRSAFRSRLGDIRFVDALDFDQDGDIDASDFFQFHKRYQL